MLSVPFPVPIPTRPLKQSLPTPYPATIRHRPPRSLLVSLLSQSESSLSQFHTHVKRKLGFRAKSKHQTSVIHHRPWFHPFYSFYCPSPVCSHHPCPFSFVANLILKFAPLRYSPAECCLPEFEFETGPVASLRACVEYESRGVLRPPGLNLNLYSCELQIAAGYTSFISVWFLFGVSAGIRSIFANSASNL